MLKLGKYNFDRALQICYEASPGLGDSIVNSIYSDALTKTFPEMRLDILAQRPFIYRGKERVNILDGTHLSKNRKGGHGRRLINRSALREFLEEKQYPLIFSNDYFLERCFPQTTTAIVSPIFGDYLDPFQIQINDKRRRIPVSSPNVYKTARDIIRGLGMTLPTVSPTITSNEIRTFKEPYILFNPHAYVPIKEWSTTGWANLIDNFHNRQESGHKTIVSRGITRHHIRNQNKIVKEVKGDVKNLGKTTINELVEIVKNSEVCVTIDTGVAHVAHAVGTKSVVLFCHTTDSPWLPPSSIAAEPYKENVESITGKIFSQLK